MKHEPSTELEASFQEAAFPPALKDQLAVAAVRKSYYWGSRWRVRGKTEPPRVWIRTRPTGTNGWGPRHEATLEPGKPSVVIFVVLPPRDEPVEDESCKDLRRLSRKVSQLGRRAQYYRFFFIVDDHSQPYSVDGPYEGALVAAKLRRYERILCSAEAAANSRPADSSCRATGTPVHQLPSQYRRHSYAPPLYLSVEEPVRFEPRMFFVGGKPGPEMVRLVERYPVRLAMRASELFRRREEKTWVLPSGPATPDHQLADYHVSLSWGFDRTSAYFTGVDQPPCDRTAVVFRQNDTYRCYDRSASEEDNPAMREVVAAFDLLETQTSECESMFRDSEGLDPRARAVFTVDSRSVLYGAYPTDSPAAACLMQHLLELPRDTLEASLRSLSFRSFVLERDNRRNRAYLYLLD